MRRQHKILWLILMKIRRHNDESGVLGDTCFVMDLFLIIMAKLPAAASLVDSKGACIVMTCPPIQIYLRRPFRMFKLLN